MARSLLPHVFTGRPAARGGRSSAPSFFPLMPRDMSRLMQEMLSSFDVSADGNGGGGDALAIAPPRLDIRESDQAITIDVELAGVNADDVEVEIDEDMLTIRGEKRLERENENEAQRVRERVYGVFTRSIQLPFAVKPDQLQATMNNGVLTITVPKSAALQQPNAHRIPVQQGGGSDATGSAQVTSIDRAAAADKPGGAAASGQKKADNATSSGTAQQSAAAGSDQAADQPKR